jgi:putative ABC transport system substrate-binding protein
MLGKHNSQNRMRTGWTLLVGVVVISLLVSGCAAPKPKVYRVGILSLGAAFSGITDGFKAKMTELGYVENKNVVYDAQETSVNADDRQRQIKKLVDNKVDLIFAVGSVAAIAAKDATQGTNIPVVFAYGQLEGTNLVKSVKEPGGNLTGVRYPAPEIIGHRLELLLEIAPQAKRVWIGYRKDGPNTGLALAALRPVASSLGVSLVEVPAAKAEELGTDLAARAQLADPGLDAILIMPDEFNNAPDSLAMLSKFATEHKVPLAGGAASMLQQGALFVNSTDLPNVGALAAPLADKIFKGTPAGTIPVVTPEQTLLINYKVAQALGLNVPEGLLRQATQVIR